MKIQNRGMKDIYREVRTEIKTTLENDEDLQDFRDVTFGERKHIGRMRTPSLWIAPETYEPQIRGGTSVQHDIPFEFITLVKSNSPEEGLQQAQDLALTVYDVLLKDRQLNGTVSDVLPERIDPAHDMGQQLQLFWSAVRFIFRLQKRG